MLYRKPVDQICRAAFLALLIAAAGPPVGARAQTNSREPRAASAKPEAPPKAGGMSADGLLGLLAARQEGARAAKWLEDAYEGQPKPESVEMLIAISRGSSMGPGEGWFHPGQARYNWHWLAARHGVKPSGSIPRNQFHGPAALFDRLDRNRDGELRADDFDWSDRSAYGQQAQIASYLFYRMSKTGDGRLTREQWIKFFDEAARGKDHLNPQDLEAGLFGGPRPRSTGGGAGMPSQQMLVRGLFSGELGSMQEGPRLNDPAPDFTLKGHDGKASVRLADLLGKKPVVLVFGSFT